MNVRFVCCIFLRLIFVRSIFLCCIFVSCIFFRWDWEYDTLTLLKHQQQQNGIRHHSHFFEVSHSIQYMQSILFMWELDSDK